MDESLKIPLPLYVVAIVLFPAPGIVLLTLEGHHSSAFLILLGMLYAGGLGRVLLWRRLGRPALPPAPRRTRARRDAPPD